MLRFPFFALLAAACLALPSFALELSDLRLPLTRSQADKVLSKDYSFRVLEDMTVRRSWGLVNRSVYIDFAPKEGDKALLIFIDYSRPVSKETATEDAEQMMGVSSGKWTEVKPKYAKRLGMGAAEGVKLEGGRFCFRELDRQGGVVRLAYFDGTPPSEARWDMADDSRESGKTAMGARASSGSTEFLWKDEERRRGLSAVAASDSLASAAAAVVADAPGAAPKPKKMIERPEQPVDVVAKVQEWVGQLKPVHWAIGGAVLALLLVMRAIARAREAKRRAMVANYIMTKGRIRTEDDEE